MIGANGPPVRRTLASHWRARPRPGASRAWRFRPPSGCHASTIRTSGLQFTWILLCVRTSAHHLRKCLHEARRHHHTAAPLCALRGRARSATGTPARHHPQSHRPWITRPARNLEDERRHFDSSTANCGTEFTASFDATLAPIGIETSNSVTLAERELKATKISIRR